MAETTKLRVAIIGAGSAGLSMCKALKDEQQIQCVVFEQSEQIGGIWVYTKDTKENKYQSPMYKNLRTNLPKELMAFPEYPFPKDLPSYIRHEAVLEYLENYTDHFGLRKFIKFQHEVISVKPCENSDNLTWQVVSRDVKNGGTQHIGVFDAVVVCKGLFTDPRVPEVSGFEDFPGTVIHSFHYDEPGDDFRNKTIIILGAKNSGMDVCIGIASVAKKVYLVHLGEKISAGFPKNVEEIVGTLTGGFPDGSVEINNKDKIIVDCVIFCTGYNCVFPFLAPECKINVTNNRVTSLYKHVFNTEYPSLSFVGLCRLILPFPHYTLQSQWVSAILTGRKQLPSREVMVNDEELDYQERLSTGVMPHNMHSLGVPRLEKYSNQIVELAGVTPLLPAFWSLYKYIISYRQANPLTYKKCNFRLCGNEWSSVK